MNHNLYDMRHRAHSVWSIGLGLLAALTACQTQPEGYIQPDAPIAEVPFTQVHFADAFWAPRIETNRTVSIPSAFHQCEINGRFDSFAIAGGLKKGEHRGDFSFDDTDPYKIIEGASYSLAAHPDTALDHYLDSVIAIIASAQEADGYLTTCVTNRCTRLSGWWGSHKWEKINSHELYNSGHLIEAAVAHFRATGKRSLLDVAIRNADLVCRTFGPEDGQIHRPGGHPIIEMALAKLSRLLADSTIFTDAESGRRAERYLATARYFVDETGRCTDGHRPSMYSQDHMPILQQDEIVGHAVRAGYLFSGVADVAALTHDSAYQSAIARIWQNMVSCKLYITGGIGSRAQGEGFGPNYELNNHTAYCETCASIANVYWNHRMFLATGHAKYVDVLERALYNGVLSGVSLSGDRFFYDNPLESMGQHERAEWFGCACCPGNITRFVASVPLYMYATQQADIYVNLYVQGAADVQTTAGKVHLDMTTGYPWQGQVELRVTPEVVGQEFAVRLRIPSWAQERPVASNLYRYVDSAAPWSICVNGKRVDAAFSDGYATIVRRWQAEDCIRLELPMQVRQVAASDSVEDDRGRLAVERGPIVYCMEGIDQHDSTVFNKIVAPGTAFQVRHEPELLRGVTTLASSAKEISADSTLADTEVRLIPYSTWQNRGNGQMQVWIAADASAARITPRPTIASRAKSLIHKAAIQKDAPVSADTEDWAWGVNDQWEPRRSSDTSKPYHYWWLQFGKPVTISYEFDKPETVSQTSVYWLDFDHYDGNFRVPESWRLYYRNRHDRWQEVTANEPYGTAKDQYNTVHFVPVTTTGLRIEAQLQKGASGGIIEWKVE